MPRRVALVAVHLDPLAEAAGVDGGDGVLEGTVALPGLEVRDGLVDLGAVVAEDADGRTEAMATRSQLGQ
ncbi:hypothetical protein ACIOEX_04090 [Streptomyces sp. NPDC087850]|uniref:hypothetical protein n=1 Tax=Streptomyces sp. NPDC087850 TaxID=3365809 RepID=UPI0038124A87